MKPEMVSISVTDRGNRFREIKIEKRKDILKKMSSKFTKVYDYLRSLV
jgi:hypothetical protein